MSRKNICIIGAGPSGLTAIKTCLEDGLNPTCYEKTSNFGGLWRYREKVEAGVSSVMKSTTINTSKEMSCFSDFPPPAHFANFMHNSRLLEYLKMYANKFNLHPFIRYDTQVIQVVPTRDFESTGRWVVKFQHKENGVQEEIFDAVMICNGHHVYPNVPTFPGLETFQGKVLHSQSYRVPEGFEDKNVLIVGAGNSALDVAVELSRRTKQLYLSTRRGTWVCNRVDTGGMPLDTNVTRRFWASMRKLVPRFLFESYVEMKLNMRFDHEEYRLKPKHRPHAKPVTISDDLPNRLIAGTIILKDDIQRFTETGVYFRHDCNEYAVDTVIFATGYKMQFPFISNSIIGVDDHEVNLYKYVFPPNLLHPTLAIIGLIQPVGAFMPISEIQSRWATKVFKGEVDLPSAKDMKAEILARTKKMNQISPGHAILVDYHQYMDEIGSLFGVTPDLWRLLFTDPQLLYHCVFGPVHPYQYRLNGPHSWPDAATAICTARKRILAPLHNRRQEIRVSSFHWVISMLMGVISFFGVIILSFFSIM